MQEKYPFIGMNNIVKNSEFLLKDFEFFTI